MRSSFIFLAMLAASTAWTACRKPTPTGCRSDADCKGARVCQAGACVEATPPAPSAAPEPVGPTPPTTATVTRRIRVGDSTAGFTVSNGSAWVAVAGERKVARVDTGRGVVLATMPAGRLPTKVVSVAGIVFTLAQTTGNLFAMDVANTSHEVTRFTRGQPYAMAQGEGAVWVTVLSKQAPNKTTLVRVDPATGAKSATASVTGWAYAVATGHGTVWLGGEHDLYRVDPNTLELTGSTPLPSSAIEILTDDSAVYVRGMNKLQRVDPKTFERVEVDLCTEAGCVLTSDGNFLISVSPQGKLVYLDMKTLAVRGTVDFGPPMTLGHAASVSPGELLVTDYTGGALLTVALH